MPRGGIYLLLLLQAVGSAAAVLWAQPLRPPNIAPYDWQQLVSLLACSAMVSACLQPVCPALVVQLPHWHRTSAKW